MRRGAHGIYSWWAGEDGTGEKSARVFQVPSSLGDRPGLCQKHLEAVERASPTMIVKGS